MDAEKITEGLSKHSISGDEDSPSLRPSNLLTRTTIREANNHLQMLYSRNQDLEQVIHKQNEELHRKDLEYTELSNASQLLERHCAQLKALLDDRTRRLQIYERKEAAFREALELKPAIESLLDVLNTFEQVHSASAAPISSTPLQFVQASKGKKNADGVHRSDAL